MTPSSATRIGRLLHPRTVRIQLHHWSRWRRYRRLRAADGVYTFEGVERMGAVFVHVPKTGGVSVSRAIYGPKGAGHHTFLQYQKIYGPLRLASYFSFTFVRHPIDRLRSAFFYLLQGGMNEVDAAWRDEHLDGITTFEDFVMGWLNEDTIWKGLHFCPQYHYLVDARRQIGVDFVGRFERLADDFACVCRHLGIRRSLGWENRTPGRAGATVEITPEMRARIVDVYAEDFARFGYDPAGG